MGVGRPLVVDRDGIEAGHAERLDVGGQLFEVAAERLLALVDAEDRLEPGGFRPARRPSRVQGDGIERLGAEAPLVSQVKDSPPLERRERLDFLQERRPLRLAQTVHDVGREPEHLRELEHEERTLLDARRPVRVVLASRQTARIRAPGR